MRTGLRVNFVKVHKVNNIIIDCAERNAEPFRKIIDAIFFEVKKTPPISVKESAVFCIRSFLFRLYANSGKVPVSYRKIQCKFFNEISLY